LSEEMPVMEKECKMNLGEQIAIKQRIQLIKKEMKRFGIPTECSLPSLEDGIGSILEKLSLKCPNCDANAEDDLDGIFCPVCEAITKCYLLDDSTLYLLWETESLKLQKVGELRINIQK